MLHKKLPKLKNPLAVTKIGETLLDRSYSNDIGFRRVLMKIYCAKRFFFMNLHEMFVKFVLVMQCHRWSTERRSTLNTAAFQFKLFICEEELRFEVEFLTFHEKAPSRRMEIWLIFESTFLIGIDLEKSFS